MKRRIGRAIAIALVALASLSSCSAFNRWNARFLNDQREPYLIQDARNRLGSYEWYYDQYNAIEAQRANIEAAPKDAPERSGMVMVLNNAIGEYNSRSKQFTHNQWKAQDLPQHIDLYGGTK